MFKFGKSSERRLDELEPELVAVARRALQLSPFDFGVACGLRSLEDQKIALKQGRTTTLKSRHLANENGLSEALDIAVYIKGKYEANDTGVYRKVCQAFVTAAIELGVHIELGCLWHTFIDSPHIQLKRW